jgi:ribosomal protein L11 methyltransferase
MVDDPAMCDPAQPFARADSPKHPWLVGVVCDASPGPAEDSEAGACARDELFGWLWERFGGEGLLAIDEGLVDVDAARTGGIVQQELVIDTAAAPADRDWVAELSRGEITLVFDCEESARAAADSLAARAGLRVSPPREAVALEPPPDAALAVPGFGWVLPPGVALPEAARPTDGLVVIEAGSGFGTGRHATTRLCLEALARHRQAGRPLDRVLDIGAGSGILGLAAARLGARRIDAVEIDAGVHAAIRHNAALNGVEERVRVLPDLASIPDDTRGAGARYDLVFANIVPRVLLEMADAIDRLVDPEGALVLSGLREICRGNPAAAPEAEESAAVVACYAERFGVAPLVTADEGWLCLVLQRIA